MIKEVGSRVGAIQSMTTTTVHLYGYGVYDGEHEPPFGPFEMPKEEHEKAVKTMKEAGQLPPDYVWKNPRISLDNGGIVWGCQCWWGSEEAVKEQIEGKTVVMVESDGGSSSNE